MSGTNALLGNNTAWSFSAFLFVLFTLVPVQRWSLLSWFSADLFTSSTLFALSWAFSCLIHFYSSRVFVMCHVFIWMTYWGNKKSVLGDGCGPLIKHLLCDLIAGASCHRASHVLSLTASSFLESSANWGKEILGEDARSRSAYVNI